MGPAQGPPQSPHLTASAQTRAPLPLPPPPCPSCYGISQGWRQRRHGSDYCLAGSEGGVHFISLSLGFLSCKMGEELEICSLCAVEGVGVMAKSCRKQISVHLLETGP